MGRRRSTPTSSHHRRTRSRRSLDDLVAYVNRDDVDPVSQAAIAHAQFEIIHPFADGNGRVGRVLIAWILVRRLSLVTPPPVSTRIAADVGGYGSGLVLFRMGDHNAGCGGSPTPSPAPAGPSRSSSPSVEQLQRGRGVSGSAAPRSGTKRLRSNAAAWRVLELLPRHLVLTGPTVASELAIPLKSANAALRRSRRRRRPRRARHGPARDGADRAGSTRAPELLGLTGSNPLR